MSSFIVSKTDSNTKPSSPISHRVDETIVRQAMHKLFLHDNINDPSSPGDNDDIHSPLLFKNNHAKFTSNSNLVSFFVLIKYYFLGELLLEWITLNSDTRNSNTQALMQEVKSCLHLNSNTKSSEYNLRKVNI